MFLKHPLVGLVLVVAVHPGNPETRAALGEGEATNSAAGIVDSFLDLGRNLVPGNIFQVSPNFLQTTT